MNLSSTEDVDAARFIPTCVGNTLSSFREDMPELGSSPRAWGTRVRRPTESAIHSVHPHVRGEHEGNTLHRQLVIRFIPTCVGNTALYVQSYVPSPGSSPRAWGTRHQVLLQPFDLPVHPHVRGEHSIDSPIESTRMRFIPTCVGNTSFVLAAPPDCAVHPHVRGEHGPLGVLPGTGPRFIPTCVGNTSITIWSYFACTGSSPRAWGTPEMHDPSCNRQTVHPHVRGEHVVRVAFLTSRTRFIPTCVGNTLNYTGTAFNLDGSSPRAWGTLARDTSISRVPSVHPHVRGEHFHCLLAGLADRGSSPRAWGTRDPWRTELSLSAVHPHVRGEHQCAVGRRKYEQRFIPTCVGNTRRSPSPGSAAFRFIPTCVGNTT